MKKKGILSVSSDRNLVNCIGLLRCKLFFVSFLTQTNMLFLLRKIVLLKKLLGCEVIYVISTKDFSVFHKVFINQAVTGVPPEAKHRTLFAVKAI